MDYRSHPEEALPFCVRHYRLRDAEGRILFERTDNHQTRNTVELRPAAVTRQLTIECLASHGPAPAALFEVRCYGDAPGVFQTKQMPT